MKTDKKSKSKAAPKKTASKKTAPAAKAVKTPPVPKQAEIEIPPQPHRPLAIEFSREPKEFNWVDDHHCPTPQYLALDFPASAHPIGAKILVARKDGKWFGGYDVDDPVFGGKVNLPKCGEGEGFTTHEAAASSAMENLISFLTDTAGTDPRYLAAAGRIFEYVDLVKEFIARARNKESLPPLAPQLVQLLPVTSIEPWPDQPRRNFDKGLLEELEASMRVHGFVEAFPLLVRPLDGEGLKYQLIAGERRWRAAQAVGIAEVPCVVRVMTDAQARELSLLENLQRADLSPIEEAEGYRGLLDLRDGDGKPLHTADSIADRIGKSYRHVRERLSLLRLRGSVAADALERGELPYTQARLIARVPSAAIRDKVTSLVLRHDGGVMPEKELALLLRENYQRELRGAPFDQADAGLVPVKCEIDGTRIMGGACEDCPHNSKNAVGEVEREPARGKAKHLCGNIECFDAKNAARYERWRQSVTDPKKKISALPFEENAALWNPYRVQDLKWDNDYIELSEDAYAPGLNVEGDPKPWSEVCKGTVPVVLAEDPKGKIHELAKEDLAIEAAKLAIPDYFSKPKRTESDVAASPEDRQFKQKKELRIAELQERKFIEAILAAKELPDSLWEVFALVLIRGYEDLVGDDDLDSVAEGLGWVDPDELENAPEDAPDAHDYLLARLREIPERQKVALFTQILIRTHATNYREEEKSNSFATALCVDISKIPEEAEAEVLAEEKREKDLSKIVEGLKWDQERAKVEDFEWDSQNVCTNPDKCTVEIPGLKKSSFVIEVGRSEKGWHVGWKLNLNGADVVGGTPANCSETAYSSPTLALKTGLLHFQHVFEQNMVDEKHVERLEAYLEALEGGLV